MDENENAAEANGDGSRPQLTTKTSEDPVKGIGRARCNETRPEIEVMSKSSTVRVDRPPVSPESTYTATPFGDKIRSQRAAVVKTWAVVTKSSWVEPDGRRVTRSTDRHLAELATSDPETIARHLAELEKAGVITIQGEGRRLIVVHDRADGVGEWRINLFDDHPAWALSPNAFKVHLGLRKFAGKNTSCNPTDRTLAKFLAMSPDSVKRGMAELRKCMGIVTTCSPFHRDRRSKARTIHLAPAKRWITTKPVDPTPDPESASLNTSMGADFGFDDRPERVDRIRNSAPEQSEICPPTIRNLPSNNPKSAPIEVLKEDENNPNRNPNPLPPKLSGQSERAETAEAEVVVVGSGSVPPPDTDPKATLANELILRFANLIEASALNAIERTDFRRALRKLIGDHGRIPGQWIEASLAVKATKNTISVGSIAIKNLRRWTELSAEERAAIPDQTQLEMHEEETAKRKARLERLTSSDSPKVVRSRFDGQERVQRADGTWANKALPPENGSGTPAHIILTERGLSVSAQAVEPPPVDPVEQERMEREKAEADRIKAEDRERSRIEFQRSQVEREVAEEINRRLAAWTSHRTNELIGTMRSDLSGMRQRLAAERTIEAERIDSEVRAEFAPKIAALGPPPGPPATIPAMVSR